MCRNERVVFVEILICSPSSKYYSLITFTFFCIVIRLKMYNSLIKTSHHINNFIEHIEIY